MSEKLDALREKFRSEMTKDEMMKPVSEHLLTRAAEDEGFLDDMLNPKKSLGKCRSYLYSEAKKLAGKASGIGVKDSTVFEWAEDYYRADEKELEKIKDVPDVAQSSSENTKKSEPKAQKIEKKTQVSEEKPKKEPLPAKKKEPKKPKDDGLSGQMTIFDMLGE